MNFAANCLMPVGYVAENSRVWRRSGVWAMISSMES